MLHVITIPSVRHSNPPPYVLHLCLPPTKNVAHDHNLICPPTSFVSSTMLGTLITASAPPPGPGGFVRFADFIKFDRCDIVTPDGQMLVAEHGLILTFLLNQVIPIWDVILFEFFSFRIWLVKFLTDYRPPLSYCRYLFSL